MCVLFASHAKNCVILSEVEGPAFASLHTALASPWLRNLAALGHHTEVERAHPGT